MTQPTVPAEFEEVMNDRPPAADDVRMRGFLRRARVCEVVDWIDAVIQPLPPVICPLSQAAGRVLAQEVVATIDVPGFDRSAMDGYATVAEQTVGASEYAPVRLKVVGEALPGRPWLGRLEAGNAVRIMTGAPIPAGADAVVPVEQVRSADDAVDVCAAIPSGKHIGRRGEDLSRGTTVLTAHRRLRPQDVGVVASLGIPKLAVVRQPLVRILVTGNELISPGEPLPPHQIYEANSAILRGLIERDGGHVTEVRRVPDDRQQLAELLSSPDADVLLISGGSSVGREDFIPLLLAEQGELAFHGIAMRPSSPAGCGRLGETLVFLLPGNPVSCLCAYDFFAGRAIRQLGGRIADWSYQSTEAVLSRKLISQVGRTDYCRVRNGPTGTDPLAISGASILSSTVRADGFVVIPEESEGHAAGEKVKVWLY
ncbi:MAG: gephyrin-like molybdotransferase Glp [Planctomycetaceae bacterium]